MEKKTLCFCAIEYHIGDVLEPTGRREIYSAPTLADAVELCLYTKRLANGRAVKGASGRTVLCGSTGYTIVQEGA